MNRVGTEHNLVGTDLESSWNQVGTENKMKKKELQLKLKWTFSRLFCPHIAMYILLTWHEAIGLEIQLSPQNH